MVSTACLSFVDATLCITRWHSSALRTQWWRLLGNMHRAMKTTPGQRCSGTWLVAIGGSSEEMRTPASVGPELLAHGIIKLPTWIRTTDGSNITLVLPLNLKLYSNS